MSNDQKLISAACKKPINYDEIVAALNAGADINARDPENGNRTALMCAAVSEDSIDTLKLLIAEGADLDLQREAGYTALMISAIWGNQKVTQTLLDAGANYDARNDYGDTAVDLAELNCNSHTANLLRNFKSENVKKNHQKKNSLVKSNFVEQQQSSLANCKVPESQLEKRLQELQRSNDERDKTIERFQKKIMRMEQLLRNHGVTPAQMEIEEAELEKKETEFSITC